MPHQHHVGHQHHQKRQNQGTVVQYVYKTAAKTFDGPVAGYSTVNAPPVENTPQPNAGNSNSNANNANNANSNPSPQSQQAAQQQAAVAAASSSAAAAQAAEASSSAVAAAEASMMTAAQPKPSVTPQTQAQAPSQTQPPVQTTPSSAPIQTSASSQQISAGIPTELSVSPSVTPTTTPSAQGQVVSSPTSSFVVATSSSTPSHTAAASDGSSSGSSGGMSGGAKAGLAIGILLAVGLLAAGIFFCLRRKRKQTQEAYGKADDEKSAYAGGLARAQSTTSTRTTATAPRLSLRPVTQFLPDLAARGKNANAAAAAAGGAAVGAAAANRAHHDPANPFGKHAEVAQPSQSSSENEKAALPIQANAPENPFTDSARSAPPMSANAMPSTADVPAPLRVRTPTPEAAAVAGAGAAAVGAGAVGGAKALGHHDAPKPLNITPNRAVSPAAPSPAASEFSQTSVSPAAFANGPPPTNVHRVQLDFKPSMEDELSLRAGQLVRLLHEYDDGWVSVDTSLNYISIANVLNRLSVFVSTALNKVSLLVLVFQLALSSLVHLQVPVDPVLAGPHQEQWVLVSNVQLLRRLAADLHLPTLVLPDRQALDLMGANNARCLLGPMGEDLSVPLMHLLQGASEEATLQAICVIVDKVHQDRAP